LQGGLAQRPSGRDARSGRSTGARGRLSGRPSAWQAMAAPSGAAAFPRRARHSRPLLLIAGSPAGQKRAKRSRPPRSMRSLLATRTCPTGASGRMWSANVSPLPPRCCHPRYSPPRRNAGGPRTCGPRPRSCWPSRERWRANRGRNRRPVVQRQHGRGQRISVYTTRTLLTCPSQYSNIEL